MKRKPKDIADQESVPGPPASDESEAKDPYLDELDSSIDMIQEEPTRFDVPAPQPAAKTKEAAESKVSEPKPKASPDETAAADLAADIPIELHVVIGEKKISLSEILALKKGSILQLGKGLDPVVDLMVQDKVVARGELVEVDGRLGVRLIHVLERAS